MYNYLVEFAGTIFFIYVILATGNPLAIGAALALVITLAKKDTLANRRLAASILGNQDIVEKLFKEIGPRVSARNGGYTRILKFGFRTGDKAPMAVMELVDRIVATEGQEKAAKKA